MKPGDKVRFACEEEYGTPSLEQAAEELLKCAMSWEPGARLLGNVTALEIARIASKHITSCPRCGAEPWCDLDCTLCQAMSATEEYGRGPKPPVERKPRLVIETKRSSAHVDAWWFADVRLDGCHYSVATYQAGTEPEARAAAQAYVDELIKHFREGGE